MKTSKYLLGILILILGVVWLAVFSVPDDKLHLVACDVGQGDAILAIYKNIQILTDGGPDNSVLDCLNRHIPFWDREIELIALTHPQKDHYQGLIEVLRRYQVDNFLYHGLDSSNEGYRVLKNEVGSRGIKVIPALTGTTIRLGLISLDVVHPSEDFLSRQAVRLSTGQAADAMAVYSSEKDPNNFSIVAKLSFGEFKAVLTGDLSPEVGDQLAQSSSLETVNYLKVPHHGSKNGLTQTLLEKINPKVAVISVGKDNSYGHPNQEIIDMLVSHGVKILRTDQLGDIEIESDGNTWWSNN